MTPDPNLLRPVSKADLDAVAARWREGQKTKKHQLLVCAGAGCVSSGCHAVKHALLAAIKDAGNNDLIQTLPAPGAPGSLGFNKGIVIDAVAYVRNRENAAQVLLKARPARRTGP